MRSETDSAKQLNLLRDPTRVLSMTAVSEDEVCRLVVQGPSSRIDLSIPVHIRLADLLPILLNSLGKGLADQGLEHSGWILQRLGESPLDEDRTLAELECLDGEVLHLRPRSAHIPPLDFDDLVDGISSGIADRSGLWTSVTTRRAGLVLGSVGITLAMLVLFWGGGGELPSGFAGFVSIVLLGLAIAARRRPKLLAAGNLFGAAAVSVSLGSLAVTSAGSDFRQGSQLIPEVAMFVLAGAVLLGVAWAARSRDLLAPVLAAVFCSGLLLAELLFLRRGMTLGWRSAAGLVLVTGGFIRLWVPLLSFKLAGLSLPALPVTVQDMQTDIDPESSTATLAGARRTDHLMTALYAAVGVSAVICSGILGAGRLWPECALVAAVSFSGLLSARVMTSLWHRLSLAVPALAGVIALTLTHTADGSNAQRCLVAAVLLLAAIGVTIAGQVYANRLPTPMWGRAGDILQALTAAAAVPILLAVLGVYAYLQHRVI